MGFFSYDCKGCEHSMRSEYAVTPETEYMMEVLAITPQGELIGAGDNAYGHDVQGYYDGYGRINVFGLKEYPESEVTYDIPYNADNNCHGQWDVWHTRCWEEAGKPVAWTGGSPSSPDQGYFFDEE